MPLNFLRGNWSCVYCRGTCFPLLNLMLHGLWGFQPAGGKIHYSGSLLMLDLLLSDPVRRFFPRLWYTRADPHSAGYFAVVWSCLSVQLPLPSGALYLSWFLWTLSFVFSTHGVCELSRVPSLCCGLETLWAVRWAMIGIICLLTVRDHCPSGLWAMS